MSKELLFYSGLHLLSAAAIAQLFGQTQRNVRKVRATSIQKLHRQIIPILKKRADRMEPLTTTERRFLEAHHEEPV